MLLEAGQTEIRLGRRSSFRSTSLNECELGKGGQIRAVQRSHAVGGLGEGMVIRAQSDSFFARARGFGEEKKVMLRGIVEGIIGLYKLL